MKEDIIFSIIELKNFTAVYTTGSTVKAAKFLKCSQAIVSQRLTSLENKINIPLFHRLNGRLHPSIHAEHFYQLTCDLLYKQQKLIDSYSLESQYNISALRIGAPRSLATSFIPNVLQSLYQNNPNLMVEVSFSDYKQNIQKVIDGELDLAISKMPILDDRVNIIPLIDAPTVVVMLAGHPLAKYKEISADKLQDIPLIRIGERVTWESIEVAFKNNNKEAKISIVTDGAGPACRLAAKGLGVTIVNKLMAQDYIKELKLIERPLVPVIYHHFVIITSKIMTINPPLREFIKKLEEQAAHLMHLNNLS